MVLQHLNIVLYCVGDIKGATVSQIQCDTPEIFVAQGSCAYTYNELPPPVCDRLARHLAVFNVLLVM